MKPQFSKPNCQPTELEQQLFAMQPTPPTTVWDEIGQRYGLAVLLGVLDIIGAEDLKPPTRRGYIEKLWRPRRDEQIREMALRHKMHHADIAEQLDVARTTVVRVLGIRRDLSA